VASTILEKGLNEVTAELEAKVTERIGTIKENMAIKRLRVLEIGENNLVVDYIHGEGAIGILVKLEAESVETLEKEEVKTFAFDCALHVAAFNPRYLSRETVPEEYVKEQEEIFTTQAENLGKPEKVIAGIVKGKMNKHFSEICLLDQPFVKDDKKSACKGYGRGCQRGGRQTLHHRLRILQGGGRGLKTFENQTPVPGAKTRDRVGPPTRGGPPNGEPAHSVKAAAEIYPDWTRTNPAAFTPLHAPQNPSEYARVHGDHGARGALRPLRHLGSGHRGATKSAAGTPPLSQ